ncbi:hypothetical protein CkaCkLH20_02226 [Colletotrichum karsti]|uniref:Rhodopsin domain-containing protein n=1 Tax=Colletotrichum karsti TaxID=1095194 RepID=A0A9P6IBC4_9PEZI|nr:uncharacterized protein CkaCkLH20_02226 [Colletotrichum karsti]KAF9880272.1 hypothetical protein CkaCkLH20_02226 [Colletotrichum karsti]
MADGLVKELIGATAAMICLTTFVMSARIAMRLRLRTYGIDDVTITVSWLLSLAMFAQTLVSAHSGLGHHHRDVNPQDYERFLKLGISTSSTYSYALALAKMSFAILYIRMLPDERLIILNKTVIVFLCCQAIEESMIPIFQCQPIAKAWAPSMPGRCLDLPVLWWVGFAFNLCTDLILFIQPIPTLWRLQLPLIKRLGLIAMLSLGLMVCAISVIRMHSVTKMGLDDTYGLAVPIIWSEAEVSTLIICSCVPSLRKIVQKLPWFRDRLEGSTDDLEGPAVPTIGHIQRKRRPDAKDDGYGKEGFGQDSGLTGTTLTYPGSILSRPTRVSVTVDNDAEEILRVSSATTDASSTVPEPERHNGANDEVIMTPLQPYRPKVPRNETTSGKE